MRAIVTVAIALLATSAIAAPVKPAQDVVDKIQLVLDKRKVASAKAADLRGKADKLEEEIGLRDSDGRLRPVDDAGVVEFAKRLLGLGVEKYEKYARQIQEYKLAQEEFRSLTVQAITMANAEYASAPLKTAGNIVSGPPIPQSDDDVPGYIGNHITINPKYSKLLPINTWGATDAAGNVLIGDGAFASPGRLAFTLYHEGQHFENLLTPGLDLRNNPREEVLLRTRQRPLLKSTFGLTDEEIVRFDIQLQSDRIRARKWDAALAQRLNPYKKSQQMAFPGGYKPLWLEDGVSQEVENILARTKELREQERAESERRRREAELSQPAMPAPYNGGMPDQSASPTPYMPGSDQIAASPISLDFSIEGRMKKIGRSACSVPVASFDSDLTSIQWGAFSKDLDYQSLEMGLSDCELRVYRRLVNFGRNWTQGAAITADDIRAEANGSFSSPGGGGGRGGVIPPKQDHDEVRRHLPIFRH